MSDEKDFKRQAMKQVRADVRAFMKGDTGGKAHLGEYPRTMEDAVRTIIALQDMLEDSQTRHRKASNMIIQYKEGMEAVTMMIQELSAHAIMDSIQKQERIGQLAKALESEREDHMETARALNEARSDMMSVQMEQSESDDQLNAAMVTLRTALNQGQF